MEFGNLKIDIGQSKLNDYLFNKSYINGYSPSTADIEVFQACTEIKDCYFHALRWFNHIKSFSEEEKKHFRQAVKEVNEKKAVVEDEDEVDLFGSDDEEVDEEAERIKQQRLDAYAAKKSTKTAIIAKSSITLDVKPWDDETDMAELEKCVRSISCDGLLWGASKLVPVGYGIKKLQIICVVEDDKVGTDFLEEEITKFEDFVQSMDVAAFNKI